MENARRAEITDVQKFSVQKVVVRVSVASCSGTAAYHVGTGPTFSLVET